MEKRTEWYLETKDWIVAEKLAGGPFVVFKTHREEITDSEYRDMERIVDHVFDDYRFHKLMNIVEDHFHAHILTDDKPKLRE